MTRPAEWIHGEDAELNQYIVHTMAPAFVAFVIDDDDYAPLSGFDYVTGRGDVLTNFYWFDSPPGETEMLELLARAADAIDEFDAANDADR